MLIQKPTALIPRVFVFLRLKRCRDEEKSKVNPHHYSYYLSSKLKLNFKYHTGQLSQPKLKSPFTEVLRVYSVAVVNNPSEVLLFSR